MFLKYNNCTGSIEVPVATMCTQRLCERHGSSHSSMVCLLYPEVGNAGQCKESNVTNTSSLRYVTWKWKVFAHFGDHNTPTCWRFV